MRRSRTTCPRRRRPLRARPDLPYRAGMRHPASTPPDPALVDTAARALLDPVLEPIVEMVITADETGYEAAAVDGRVRFRRADTETGWVFTEDAVEGRNPLGDQSTDRFSPLDAERAAPYPDRTETSYPFAYEMVAQVFDHPAAPDLICMHTAAHNWEDHGGERGEHGSMGVVQATGAVHRGRRRRASRSAGCRAPAGWSTSHRRCWRSWAARPTPTASGSTAGRVPTRSCGDRTVRSSASWSTTRAAARPRRRLPVRRLQPERAATTRSPRRRAERRAAHRDGHGFEHGAMSSMPTVTLANHTRSSPAATPATTAS